MFPKTSAGSRRLIAAVTGLLLVLLAGCGDPTSQTSAEDGEGLIAPDASRSPSGDEFPIADGMIEDYTFDSLSVMTATSDVILIGEVVTVEREEFEEGFEWLVLEIDAGQVLGGDLKTGDGLVVESDAGFAFPSEWRTPGTEVLAFLQEKATNKRYRIVNTQSVFVVKGEELTPIMPDDFANNIAEGGLRTLIPQITRAVTAADRGEVEPQKPWAERTDRPSYAPS